MVMQGRKMRWINKPDRVCAQYGRTDRLRAFLVKVCLLVMVTAASFQAQATAQLIEPGDKVLLRIAGVVDKTFEVDHNGFINFELWGHAKGCGSVNS